MEIFGSMRSLYFVFGLSLFTLFSCKRESKPAEQNSENPIAQSSPMMDSLPKDGTDYAIATDSTRPIHLRPKPKVDFKLKEFLHSADSLVNAEDRNRFRVEIKPKLPANPMFDVLHPANAAKVQYYSFLNKNNAYFFWVLRLTYNDGNAAAQALNDLRKYYHEQKEANFLTKANDYVVRAGNQVIWLNNPCSFSKQTHAAMKQNLLRNMQMSPISDSITCRCGMKCF
jgi:hypothetical protein